MAVTELALLAVGAPFIGGEALGGRGRLVPFPSPGACGRAGGFIPLAFWCPGEGVLGFSFAGLCGHIL